jgi:hypothetical protein
MLIEVELDGPRGGGVFVILAKAGIHLGQRCCG